MKNLLGPIYDVPVKHNFEGMKTHMSELKTLAGPVFKIDRKHGYDEIPDRIDPVHQLQGMIRLWGKFFLQICFHAYSKWY